MRLLLVRHAMCDPVGRSLAGRRDGVHLNGVGRAQAEALARALREERIAAVYTSPLERAVETARAVADAAGAPLHEAPGLTEFDFGEWTGRPIASLEGDETWTHFNVHRSGTRAPGGELALEAQARAVAAIQALSCRHADDTVVAVSHADIIRSIVGHVLGIPLDLQHRLEVSPASISTLELRPWGGRVLRMNHVVP